MKRFIFVLNKEQTIINSLENDDIEDVFKNFSREKKIKEEELIYFYKGKKLNPNKFNRQIKSEDYMKNKIIILCFKIKKIQQKEEKIDLDENLFPKLLKSKEILCPECGESCKIKLNNFKITLYKCQNEHKNTFDFEQFSESQISSKSLIKCNICNNIQKMPSNEGNKYYKCLTCNKNICNSCNEKHNKEHKIIDYSKSNFICNIHNQKYVSYCNICEQNLCSICEKEHIKENDLIYFKNMIPNNINDTEDEEFKFKITQFNNYISGIIEVLNKLINKVKIYYEIYNNYAYNFDIKNINYYIVNNINEISKYNVKIINEINSIINEVSTNIKINNLFNLYYNIFKNNENTIKYEIKNGDKNVKIFGNTFVKNNKDKCRIIFNEKEYDLKEYFDITNYKNEKNILEIELKINNNLEDMSYMFDGCSSLLYLSNNWNTNEVTNMSYIFKDCLSLKNIFGISEWKTNNVVNMEGMFFNCLKLTKIVHLY